MKQKKFNHQFIFRSLAILGLTGISLLTPQSVLSVGSVSPTIDASNGFPISYADTNGVIVVPCIDGTDPKCVLPAAGEEPNFDPSKPTEFPNNFMSEFFYWIAESESLTTPGGKVFMRFALEGAFLNEDPLPGDQMVFGRIRITGTGLEPNSTYIATHPYGVDTYITDALGTIRRGDGTEDIGCEISPCDFSLSLGSRVMGAFLKAELDAPAGYLGDAITPHTVVGAPTGNNFVKIEGPGLPAEGLQTNLFTVSGKLAGNVPPPPPPLPVCEVNTAPDQSVLNLPIDGATEVAVNPTLSWGSIASFGTNCLGNNNQFELFIDPGNVDPFTSQGVFPGNQFSVAVTGLSENTTYSWKIRANNGALTTDSVVKTFTTVVPIPVTPPIAPSNLKANSMGTTIRLTWVDNSNNETEFKILRKVGATGVFSQIATVLGDTAIFTDNTAPKGLIFYKIQACSIAGCSDFSNTAIVFKATSLVAKPINLRAVNSVSGIQLSWRDNATTETQYIIEKRNSFQSAFTQLTILSSNATSFTDTTAVRGLNIYRVKACNVDSCSDYSNTAIVFKP